MTSEEFEKRKKSSFLQSEGLAPLPRLSSGTSVSKRFSAMAYSILMASLTYENTRFGDNRPTEITMFTWVNYFNEYADEIPYAEYDFRRYLKEYISNGARLLDLLQYCAREHVFDRELYESLCSLLEEELVAFRFVGDYDKGEATLMPVSDEGEAAANDEDYASLSDHPNAQRHFLQAVEELKSGHYRVSVSESISGVESTIKSLTGKPGVTLGDGLKLLGKESELHPALKKGLDSIYGWTNSPNGMRHALSDEAKEVTEAESRYMLSACLAFSAWLKRTAATKM